MSSSDIATKRASLLRGTVAVIASACCFGSVPPLTVVATRRGMALESVQSWRYVTSVLLLTLFSFVFREKLLSEHNKTAGSAGAKNTTAKNNSADPGSNRRTGSTHKAWYSPRILLLAGGGQALIASLALGALYWLPAATASFLYYTYPAWVAVFAATRGMERMDPVRITALLLSLMGLAIMTGMPGGTKLSGPGVLCALAAAVIYALYIPLLHHLQSAHSQFDIVRAISLGCMLSFLLWSLASGSLLTTPDPIALTASIAQGALSIAAFMGFLIGIRQLGPVRTAITSTVEPFWTTLLGAVFLAQPAGITILLGGCAIMAAVVLLQRSPGGLAPS